MSATLIHSLWHHQTLGNGSLGDYVSIGCAMALVLAPLYSSACPFALLSPKRKEVERASFFCDRFTPQNPFFDLEGLMITGLPKNLLSVVLFP